MHAYDSALSGTDHDHEFEIASNAAAYNIHAGPHSWLPKFHAEQTEERNESWSESQNTQFNNEILNALTTSRSRCIGRTRDHDHIQPFRLEDAGEGLPCRAREE